MKLVDLVLSCFLDIEQYFGSKFIEEFCKGEYKDCFQYHFTLGIYIRNEFLINTPLFQLFRDCGLQNVDDMSDWMIRLFYLYEKGKRL